MMVLCLDLVDREQKKFGDVQVEQENLHLNLHHY
jgi:hypothetical protein